MCNNSCHSWETTSGGFVYYCWDGDGPGWVCSAPPGEHELQKSEFKNSPHLLNTKSKNVVVTIISFCLAVGHEQAQRNNLISWTMTRWLKRRAYVLLFWNISKSPRSSSTLVGSLEHKANQIFLKKKGKWKLRNQQFLVESEELPRCWATRQYSEDPIYL